MTEMKARLGKSRWVVLCGDLDGAGCGYPLALVVLRARLRFVWIPPDRVLSRRTRCEPSEQVWEVSKRAVRQLRSGHAPIASRKLIREYTLGIGHRGGPVGWIPRLPMRILCRCGKEQWLDAAELEVVNTTWATWLGKTRTMRCAEAGCARGSGQSGYCDEHSAPPDTRNRPMVGDLYELDQEADLQRWESYRQAIS